MTEKGCGVRDTMDYICTWETDSETDNSESICDLVSHPFYSPPTGRPHP